MSILSLFNGNLDQLVISLALQPYALGLYTVSSSIGSIIPSAIIGAISIYLWPKLMDMSKSSRLKRVEHIHSTLFYVTISLSFIASLALPILVPIIYGSKYIPAIYLGEILVFVAPANVAYSVLTYFLSSENKFNHITMAELLGLIVGATLLLVMMRAGFGTMGAALAVLSSALVKWIYVLKVGSDLGLNFAKLIQFYPSIFVSAIHDIGLTFKTRFGTRTDATETVRRE